MNLHLLIYHWLFYSNVMSAPKKLNSVKTDFFFEKNFDDTLIRKGKNEMNNGIFMKVLFLSMPEYDDGLLHVIEVEYFILDGNSLTADRTKKWESNIIKSIDHRGKATRQILSFSLQLGLDNIIFDNIMVKYLLRSIVILIQIKIENLLKE